MKFTVQIPSREEAYLAADRAARKAKKVAAGLERTAAEDVHRTQPRPPSPATAQASGPQQACVGELVYGPLPLMPSALEPRRRTAFAAVGAAGPRRYRAGVRRNPFSEFRWHHGQLVRPEPPWGFRAFCFAALVGDMVWNGGGLAAGAAG